MNQKSKIGTKNELFVNDLFLVYKLVSAGTSWTVNFPKKSFASMDASSVKGPTNPNQSTSHSSSIPQFPHANQMSGSSSNLVATGSCGTPDGANAEPTDDTKRSSQAKNKGSSRTKSGSSSGNVPSLEFKNKSNVARYAAFRAFIPSFISDQLIFLSSLTNSSFFVSGF